MKMNDNLVIFGLHPCIAALQNKRRKIKEMIISNTKTQSYSELMNKYRKITPIRILSNHQLSQMLPPDASHQGIALITQRLENVSMEEILRNDNQKMLIVALDHIQDSHNVGAIIRSAAAFNANAILIPKDNSPEENSTIVKTACGAVDLVPISYITNINSTIKLLKDHGFWCYGLDGSGESELHKITFHNKTLIILGSEKDGIRSLVSKNCDFMVKIPNSNTIESLNVSNASAVAMYTYFVQNHT